MKGIERELRKHQVRVLNLKTGRIRWAMASKWYPGEDCGQFEISIGIQQTHLVATPKGGDRPMLVPLVDYMTRPQGWTHPFELEAPKLGERRRLHTIESVRYESGQLEGGLIP